MTVMESAPYTGVDNLEVMSSAKNYNSFLVRLVDGASDGEELVDFGAGSGTFDVELKKLGRSVICVELDKGLRQVLRQKGFMAVGSLAELKQPAKFIFSLNVLEHIQNDQEVIKDIFEKLKPGGQVLLYVPAFGMLWSSMDKKVGHHRRYTKADLAAKVCATGFEVERARYVDSLGFLATLLFKVMGNKKGDLNRTAVAAFDKFIFPLNYIFDPILGNFLGKNVLLVAKKP